MSNETESTANARVASALRERDEARQFLRNLVARIDRDGGHQQTGEALGASYARADSAVARLLVTVDANARLQARVAELEALCRRCELAAPDWGTSPLVLDLRQALFVGPAAEREGRALAAVRLAQGALGEADPFQLAGGDQATRQRVDGAYAQQTLIVAALRALAEAFGEGS